MKAPVAAVGIIAFIIFFAVTIVVSPTFPPGMALYNVLCDFFGIPKITYSLFGFTGEALVHGLLNGTSWGLLIAVTYYFGRRSLKRELIFVPVTTPTPQPISTPILTGTPHQRPQINLSREVRPITTYISLDKSVQMINGIGPKYGNRFRFHGVEDLSDLLREGATEKGRRYLAAKVGVSINKMNRWVNQADFFRIKGIGTQYADLLDAAGVNTVVGLSKRNPMTLYEKIKETNWNKNLVDRTPPYGIVQGWVQRAKKLEPIVAS